MRSKIFLTTGAILSTVILLVSFTSRFHKPVDPADIKKAASKALVALQESGNIFIDNAHDHCGSCHHTTITSMAVNLADQKGVPVIDSLKSNRIMAMAMNLKYIDNPNRVNDFLWGVNFLPCYLLLGLHAEKYPADFITDISVDYLMSQANKDGSFLSESGRAPLEAGNIHSTAMMIKAIQLYASPAKKKIVDELVARTRTWLESQAPDQQQEIVFQLLGMQWCGSSDDKKMKVAQQLRSMQNADGGWSQLPLLKSDAYATGQALYALYESKVIKPEDETYQKGLQYLLNTTDDEGVWEVATRSYPIQPHFSTDFPPYDNNQFISAAATGWSVIALLNALPDKTN